MEAVWRERERERERGRRFDNRNLKNEKKNAVLKVKTYEARVRFGTQVRVRDSAIFEKGGCGCGGTRRLKNC